MSWWDDLLGRRSDVSTPADPNMPMAPQPQVQPGILGQQKGSNPLGFLGDAITGYGRAVLGDGNATGGQAAWAALGHITNSVAAGMGSPIGQMYLENRAGHDPMKMQLQGLQLENERMKLDSEKRRRDAFSQMGSGDQGAAGGFDPKNPEHRKKLMQAAFASGDPQMISEARQLEATFGKMDAESVPKAPPMRTVMQGGSNVQQELQPDGTWSTIGGGPRFAPGAGATNVTVSPQIIMPGHDEPTKGEKTDLQGKTITTNDMLSRLRETERLYNPAYQQLGTKAGMWASRWTEKLGGSLSAEDADQFEKYSTFRATAYDNLSQTLKEMSGAAVTPQEYERLKQSLPDPGTGITGSGDSPTEFESKLKRATRSSKLALLRYGYAQSLGIPIDGIPLEVGTMKQRIGDKTEKEALAAGKSQDEAEALAVETVKRTFGGM